MPVTASTTRTARDWPSAIAKVPAGKRLDIRVARDELEISLVDAPHRGAPAELVPVPAPERVGRYHVVARAFRDRSERHEISRELLPRATRLVHAIAVEAVRRGWSATPVADPEPRTAAAPGRVPGRATSRSPRRVRRSGCACRKRASALAGRGRSRSSTTGTFRATRSIT